ncbi:transcriptional regulator with XRE-family HTH domain [Sporomusaceae bacterium BoRhaA]|nr:transcriptional regulator with XRE-family HTH domain [Pelorhabdus rhamnosifermentans]
MTSPSADTLVAMSNYFNVSLDYLAGLSDKPEKNDYVKVARTSYRQTIKLFTKTT